jgi:hypothetical protein
MSTGQPYEPIWPFEKDSSVGQVTYKRLLSLSERASCLAREVEALQKDILTWMQIDANERGR